MPAPRIATSGVALVALALSLMLRARDPPRLPWEDHAQPVPGTGGNVFLLEDFLSEAEVRHIMAAGRDALGLGNPSAAPLLAQQARMYASAELQTRDDPVLAALDERIANLTGIPVHSGEGTFRVAVSRPWHNAAAANDIEVQRPPSRHLPHDLCLHPLHCCPPSPAYPPSCRPAHPLSDQLCDDTVKFRTFTTTRPPVARAALPLSSYT